MVKMPLAVGLSLGVVEMPSYLAGGLARPGHSGGGRKSAAIRATGRGGSTGTSDS